MDLELHANYYKKFHGKNLDQATRDLIAPYVVPTTLPQPSVVRNFLHCIQGYDARYYAYVLAEVMAADLHEEFKRNGLNNSAIGRNYRKTILEAGNSRPAAELYRSFMGRTVSTEAFLRMLPK
jgi:oligopeptidase A